MSDSFLNSPKMKAAIAAPTVRPFVPRNQLAFMADACRGPEKEFFMQKFVDLAELINTMPKTYEQDGKGDDAIAYLHYFCGGNHWFITEKDCENGGVDQAFGYAILNEDDECAELGYISIKELTDCIVELDLHFTPKSLATIKAERACQAAESNNERPG